MVRFFAKDGEELAYSERGSHTHRSDSPAPIEVGGMYKVRIEEIAKKGDGLARIEGLVIFVPGTKVGDEVDVQIDNVRQNFASAHVV